MAGFDRKITLMVIDLATNLATKSEGYGGRIAVTVNTDPRPASAHRRLCRRSRVGPAEGGRWSRLVDASVMWLLFVMAAQRHLTHLRTRKKSPWTRGQIERFFRSIKYEDLYRNDIADGIVLNRRVENYLTVYNSVRPHEAISMHRPLELYRHPPKPNLPD
jgi:transposase InsO family protein